MGIEHVMERIGRITAADNQLEVRVRGVDAYAGPGYVNIPAIETYKWLGENAARMLHGLLDHEVGHARDTDFDVVEALVREKKLPLKALFNAVEDVRIEASHGRRYIGVAQNLAAMNEWLVANAEWQEQMRKPQHPWHAFCCAVSIVGGGTCDIEFVESLNPLIALMLREADDNGLLDGLKSLSTSTAALERSQEIFDLFKMPPSPEEEEGDDGEGTKKPEEGGDEEKSGKRKPSKDDDAEEGDGEPEEGASDGKEGEGEEDGEDDAEGGGGAPGGEDEGSEGGSSDERPESGKPGKGKPTLMDFDGFSEDGALDPEHMILAAIHEKFIEPSDSRPYTIFSHEFDIERDFSIETYDTHQTREWNALEAEARAASDALSGAFEVGLRSRREKRPIPGNDEGEIDPGMLAEYAVGSATVDTIYQQWVAEDDRDTAAAILFDCSGSMTHDGGSRGVPQARWQLARLTGIAIHIALRQVQIAHEMTGFTSVSTGAQHGHAWLETQEWVTQVSRNLDAMREALVEAADRGTEVENFAREYYEPGWRFSKPVALAAKERPTWARRTPLLVPMHAIFKSFALDDPRGLLRVRGIHENLDGEAVLWQARRLAQRPEARRVMFVLSDGMPLGSRIKEQGARYLKEVIDRVIDAGIEIYAIGMMSDHVRGYYPRSWVCNDLSDLTQIAMSSLTEVLLESRQERACVRL